MKPNQFISPRSRGGWQVRIIKAKISKGFPELEEAQAYRNRIVAGLKLLKTEFKITEIVPLEEMTTYNRLEGQGVCKELLEKLAPLSWESGSLKSDPIMADIITAHMVEKQKNFIHKQKGEMARLRVTFVKDESKIRSSEDVNRCKYWLTTRLAKMKVREVTSEAIQHEKNLLLKTPIERGQNIGKLRAPNTIQNFINQLGAVWSQYEIDEGSNAHPRDALRPFMSKRGKNREHRKQTTNEHTIEVRPFTEAEAAEIVRRAYAHDAAIVARGCDTKTFRLLGPLVELTMLNGLRRKFAININISDIKNWGANDGKYAYIKMVTKWDKESTPVLSNRAVEILTKLWPAALKNDGWFFASWKGTPMKNWPSDRFDRDIIGAMFGLPLPKDIHAVHSMRDTVSARLIEQSVPTPIIAKMLGITVATAEAHYVKARNGWREDVGVVLDKY